MTFFDIDNLLSDRVDKIHLAESLCDSPASELLDTYKILSDFVNKLLEYPDTPQLVYFLSEMKYVYALEIFNRCYYYLHDSLLSSLPNDCVKSDYDTLQ